MSFNSYRTALRRLGPSLIALAALLGACTSDETSRCSSDADCTLAGTRCDLQLAQCVCVTDEACEAGFFCNSAGVCQERSGCSANRDCPEGSYCDVASGDCLEGLALIEGARCGLASHCGFGQLCVDGRCQAGCFDGGDCPVGEICRDGQCVGGVGICDEDANCEYGESCDVAAQVCRDNRRGPYCRACTQRIGANDEPCDDPATSV